MDDDSKAIQQIEFVGQIKRINENNDDGIEFMVVSTILEKIIIRFIKDDKAIVKLTNAQLNKLKSSAKNKTRTTLRITK